MTSPPRLRFGDIVWVSFKYTDGSGEKERPVVVVSSTLYHSNLPDYLVMGITTSSIADARFGSVDILDLKPTGLFKPSTIKPIIQTMEKSRIGRKSGHLDSQTAARLKKVIRELFG
jgi:mRNA-degrading endonuclease toxin of MazEF toxin-antitoxin module